MSHAEDAEKNLVLVKESKDRGLNVDQTLRLAQVQATLALAHEMRTANFIARTYAAGDPRPSLVRAIDAWLGPVPS